MTGHDGASAARGLVTNATAERQGDLPQTGRATMGVTPSTGARCTQRPGPPAPHEPAPREALHTNAMKQDHFLAQRQRNKTSRIFSPPTFFFFAAGEFSNSQQTDGVTRVDDKTERKGRAKSRWQRGGRRGGRGGRRRKKGRREPARRAHAAPRKRPRETHAVSAARAAPVDGTKNDRNR